MRIVRTPEELREKTTTLRGLVPTMGAFHDGHLSLMRTARAECEEVLVTLFVNPLQFGPSEDLSRYPRQEERDAELAESAGVDTLFAPSVQTMVSLQRASVRMAGLSERYEGAHRPGHFDGVATIVAKLFHIADAEIAYFGLKDRQQCAVIEAMVKDLNFPIQLRMQPTVREGDGLALSSRNIFLSPEERLIAPSLYVNLRDASQRIANGEPVNATLEDARHKLQASGFAVDYFDLIDVETFSQIEQHQANAVIVTAAKLGRTRLIDNLDVPFYG